MQLSAQGLDEPASFKTPDAQPANPTLIDQESKRKEIVLARAMQVYGRDTPTVTKQRINDQAQVGSLPESRCSERDHGRR
jgi:hypothetical protein